MYSLVTKKARNKMMKSRAEGIAVPKVVGFKFGKGGFDNVRGVVIEPSEDQLTLNDEIYQKVIDGYEYISELVCRFTCTLNPDELAGQMISEIALYDEDNDLVAIKNFTPKGKDSDLEMVFQIDDNFELQEVI